MLYKYPTDGDMTGPPEPGNESAGWEDIGEFEKRRKSRLHRGWDWLFGSHLDRFEASAERMFKKYPRAEGLKCDAASQRNLAIGEDFRLSPFGTLPWGWPDTLDMGRYEG